MLAVYLPEVIRGQMIFSQFPMLKMFLSAVIAGKRKKCTGKQENLISIRHLINCQSYTSKEAYADTLNLWCVLFFAVVVVEDWEFKLACCIHLHSNTWCSEDH